MLVLGSHLGKDPGFGYIRKTTRMISDWTVNLLTACLISLNGVGVSRGYTDYYQGRGHSIRPTAALINIHEHLI